MVNHFTLEKKEYKRDLDVVRHYVEDSALYIHKNTGKPLEQCFEFVRRTIKSDGKLPITDSLVMCLTRNEFGDREKELIPFSDYIKDVATTNKIMSPTMAVYLHPDEKESLTSSFIIRNIGKRNVSKGEMHVAKAEKNNERYIFKSNEQSSFKTTNNSLSGAQVSNGTILCNKSAHSSLTSGCRITTSYGNAVTEKFLYGNRHYWSPEIVKGNIVSIINNTNFKELESVIERYNIVHPSAEDAYQCAKYSIDLYQTNVVELAKIKKLISALTPIERSAFVYSGDLYHLAKHNDELVRTFLDKLSSKATIPIDNPEEYMDQLDPDLIALVSLLCAKELDGESLKVIKVEKREAFKLIGATAKHILTVLDDYQFLIKGLWRVETTPASVANIRGSIRRGVIGSDTDSTIFTVQSWTKWVEGEINFSEKSLATSYAVVYINTQYISHILAKLSANMGVVPEEIHTLRMKNEYAFPVFALTTMAKHYFAYMSAQEGNVFPELDTEIKGVYLKDSNAPPHIMKEFHNTLRFVMDEVMAGRKISIVAMLKKIAGIEKEIMESVKKGDSFYLSNGQVKERDSYTNPDSSPYRHYLLWNSVFAAKYGNSPKPPYQAVKVQVNLKGINKVNQWLDTFKDIPLRNSMKAWVDKSKSNAIGTLLVPKNIVFSNGMPEEIIAAIDMRKLVYGAVKQYYILLETLGYYMINKNLTKLASDMDFDAELEINGNPDAVVLK